MKSTRTEGKGPCCRRSSSAAMRRSTSSSRKVTARSKTSRSSTRPAIPTAASASSTARRRAAVPLHRRHRLSVERAVGDPGPSQRGRKQQSSRREPASAARPRTRCRPVERLCRRRVVCRGHARGVADGHRPGVRAAEQARLTGHEDSAPCMYGLRPVLGRGGFAKTPARSL